MIELELWPAQAGKGIDDVLAAGRAGEIEVLSGDAARMAVEEIATAAGGAPRGSPVRSRAQRARAPALRAVSHGRAAPGGCKFSSTKAQGLSGATNPISPCLCWPCLPARSVIRGVSA